MEKEVAKEEFNLKFGEVTRIGGQGAVKSVNGQVGDVILTTSDIENTSGYQDEDEVAAAINRATETLQGEIDDLSADKQDKLTAGENITIEGNVISATGGETVNVVQSTGDSTTDVMSQKATTDMVYGDGDAKTNVRLGSGATTYNTGSISVGQKASSGSSGVAIGSNTTAYNTGVAIGQGASTSTRDNVVIVGKQVSTLLRASDNSVYLGSNVRSANTYPYSVALGNGATITRRGEVNISTGDDNTNGYDNTNYRILGGVHDPVEAQDAATKNYVDAAVAGAGGGGVKELTADDYNAPASNPTAVALALLEPGVYVWKNNVNVRVGEGSSNLTYSDGRSAIVGYGNAPSGSSLRKIVFRFGGASNNSNADVPMEIYTMTENLWTYETSKKILTDFSIVNVLTSTSTSRPLSANQGKVLNDKITALEARVAALEGN